LSKPFKIYKSSAGSGKTYTLVLTYLSILLTHKDPYQFRKVLAVTFTNKAANEMKERVIQGLEKLHLGSDKNFISDYVNATHLSPEELSERAFTILSAILHDYSSFNILTIDKFTHRIIRSFSRELGLTNNFELETNSDEFYKRSIDQLLNDVGVDKQLTDFLVAYNQSLFDEEKPVRIESSLLELSNLLGKENSKHLLGFYEDKDLSYFIETRKKILVLVKEKREEICQLNNAVLQLFEQAQLNPEELKNGNSKIGSIFISFKEGDFYKEISEPQLRNISEGNWMSDNGKKTNPTMGAFVEQNGSLLTKKTLEIFTEINALKFLDHLQNELVAFSLLNAIKGILEDIKKDNNIIFIRDFNEIISNVIKNEQSPYIYEKIGSRFNHFLIDEFQDTSTLQWHNMVPLMYDSLASEHTNLIVGDAKQAIYRFRGGEVDQFVALPNVEADLADIDFINAAFVRNADVQILEKNYRSAEEIIRFNNWFFDHFVLQNDRMSDKIKAVFSGFKQEEVRTSTGLVKVDFLTKENDEETLQDKIHEKVVEYIVECEQDGYSLDDICILIKTKKDGYLITNYLVQKGYNVVSVDSVLLGTSKAVMDCMFHFQAINNPIDSHIIKCLINENKETQESTTELFEKYRIPKEEQPYYSKGFEFDRYLNEHLINYSKEAYASLSIFDKVDFLVKSLGYLRTDPFIDKLLNVAFEFMQSNGSNANLFVAHFFEKAINDQVNAKNASGSIQLMTIHKSKGLQFPVVILPYDFGDGKFTDLGWIGNAQTTELGLPIISSKLTKKLNEIGFSDTYLQHEMENKLDLINVYYVAFTRPEDRLYFIQSKKLDFTKDIQATLQNHPQFDYENFRLVLGERNQQTQKASVEAQITKLPSTTSWRDKIELSPSPDYVDDELALETISDSDQLFGKIIHEIIALNTDVKELNSDCTTYIQQKKINPKVGERLKKCIQLLAENELYSSLFKDAILVLKERELIGASGIILRPDLVIYKENETVLIDFKTGVPKKSHQKQLEQYSVELEQIALGKTVSFTKLKKYLIYLSDNKIDCLYV
jgi:ATP-dependent exoDNAse (exonuclease V) beta subunit